MRKKHVLLLILLPVIALLFAIFGTGCTSQPNGEQLHETFLLERDFPNFVETYDRSVTFTHDELLETFDEKNILTHKLSSIKDIESKFNDDHLTHGVGDKILQQITKENFLTNTTCSKLPEFLQQEWRNIADIIFDCCFAFDVPNSEYSTS